MSIISKETRILWRRRIKGFWDEFSRKKIGLVGLGILLFFVGVAVFAPWLTPYDPIEKKRVAQSFAMPAWMTILSENRDLPTTKETRIDWRVVQGSEFVASYGRRVTVAYEAKTLQAVRIRLESNYTYTEKISPKVFFSEFTWSTDNVNDVRYTIEQLITTPAGKSYLLYFIEPRRVATGEAVHIDSDNPILLLRLGLDPGIDNLSRIIFVEPGVYKLTLKIGLNPDTIDATCNMNLQSSLLSTLGAVHGILGCDEAGADLFAQLVYGAQVSLAIGCLAAAISTSIGILVGVTAGYVGGVVDESLMRIVDILLCLPILPLLLTLVFLFGKSVFYIVLFVAIFGWQGLSRVIRSQVLSLREQTFVECARASGASRFYIMIKHLIPNVLPIAFASLVLAVPSAILFEATLSFLGFGDPRSPTWGKMLHHAFGFGGFTHYAWWWILPPGLAITSLCLAFVFIGHAVDEVVNPRLRRRR
jgi:peptide/nickel transport system permease protein